MTTHVNCPHCGQTVPWTPESRWRPFCSERCRLIDLGDWLDERHRIAAVDEQNNELDAAASNQPPVTRLINH